MPEKITLNVNGTAYRVTVEPETPLLYFLRNDLGLKGPKFGCGLEQCNACKVLIDGSDVPSCQIPVGQVAGLEVTTIEGLGTADELHPLQEAFIEEQAIQCGYCASGMIIGAQGLLNRTRYPTDQEIREALSDHICRCGVYDRVRRAIKLRIGRPEWEPIYDVIEMPALAVPPARAPESHLPANIQQAPEVDAWIRFNTNETVTVFTGKAEIGQGIKTAVAQIAAEELDVALGRIEVVSADTEQTPNEGLTAGSMSVERSGLSLRYAAAEARAILLRLAQEELEAETAAAQLTVVDGTISDPATGRQVSYWTLMGGRPFGRQISGPVVLKAPDNYQLVGQPVLRQDLAAKVTGQASYIQDMVLPGMVYGRVVRPPSFAARLVSVAEAPVQQLPGVMAVVRDGSFLGVVAEREEQAVWAADRLRETAVWDSAAELPAPETLFDVLRSRPAQSNLVVNGSAGSDPIPEPLLPDSGARVWRSTYQRPYQMHGSLGPSAAIAQLEAGLMTVWSHSQGVFFLVGSLAQILEMDEADVHVIHAENAGCYGHNGADDAALDAALLARAVPGSPVMVQWMRADEHMWEPYGAAMEIEVAAKLDEADQVTAWQSDVWSFPHSTRPRRTGPGQSGLLAAWHLAEPWARTAPKNMLRNHFGGYRNADPLYAFPQRRIISHFVEESPLRTSSLRGLGAYANIFAVESFMDELASAAGRDPVEFRLRHLTDERAVAVIKAVAKKAGWSTRARPVGNGRGQGIAFAQYKNVQCYAAIVVDVEVDQASGEIHLKRVVIAADAGQIVNPDGLSNQLEGGFVQAASWTLAEAVNFDRDGIQSQDWDSYPLLRFSGIPAIETVLLNRPSEPFLGAGEATQNPTPAAIANAVYDAVGIRLRRLPFTPDTVRQLMSAS